MSNAMSKLITILATLATVVGLYVMFRPHAATNRLGWERWVEPGNLSSAHASLENNCAACHSSITGVSASKCILCHANNTALLQRQPTAFHASVGACNSCHIEHKLDTWISAAAQSGHLQAAYPHATAMEASLNCTSCHSNQDPHLGYFGRDCVQCHSTSRWTIAGYQHPSPQSTQCNECHKPPPSHSMGHFNMMDQGMTGQKDAKLSECFKCHQTNSWNDIKAVGWFKMH
jgi:hypothetical protein